MKLGTLSEKRTLPQPTTQTPEKVETPVLKVVEEQPPLKDPVLVVEEPQKPVDEPKQESATKCGMCKAKSITALAIRGSIVLVLLALCFNLIKTAK